MSENKDKSTPQQNDSFNNVLDYLNRAAAADEAGDALLSMYLYLAAFEQKTVNGDAPSEDVITGLKQAWALACANKERSLAEYIFELLEPYLSTEEMELCARELQDLALDKLEEFGISRDDLEDMASMISDDLLGLGDSIIKVESLNSFSNPIRLSSKKKDPDAMHSDGSDSEVISIDDATLIDRDASGDPSSSTEGKDGAEDDGSLSDALPTSVKGLMDRAAKLNNKADAGAARPTSANEYLEKAEADLREFFGNEKILNYDSLSGYRNAIQTMRDIGIGMNSDEDFKKFVSMLNEKHGLNQMPALDAILLRSPAREDANRFMYATLGELALPTIHMKMEENYQGMPILCVSAHSIDIPKNNSLKDVFVNGGVLVLEDLDLWSSPVSDIPDDNSAFLMMQLTRGAREAVNLIGSAVDNPDVFVIVTTSAKGNVDSFFLDILGTLAVVDIDFPTPEERVEIWMEIAQDHPSLQGVNKAELVRLSANMARYDIYMAAREAIEEAYKQGLVSREFKPITRDNIFDKLAAYQPLESAEYSELEEAVIQDFQCDLDHIDDILDTD